jgi:hypothetical protein
MSWATEYIKKLKLGETVKFRPVGNSMAPLIKSGELCTVKPVGNDDLFLEDIVLCSVNGSQYLHLIKDRGINEYLIGNNRGKLNGWITHENIHGILIKIEK